MTSRQTEPELKYLSVIPRSLNERLVARHIQLVDIGVEDAVHEADARALVGVLIGQLNVDLPETALEWRCSSVSRCECSPGQESYSRLVP